jgi:ribonuclease P protein component
MKNNLGLNRFGFVVSQKVSKKATVRNKIRRRLAEVIKAEMKNIKIGTDMVLIALPGIEKKGFSDIKGTVGDALIKTELITNNLSD